jgi:GT2 family glycosyltransferase
MKNRPVVAAIPTYNMTEQAAKLIDDLLHESLTAIYVLDDNSAEDTKAILEKRFGGSVKVITGDKNIGAGGNRNRILQVAEEDSLSKETAIVFIDADTRFEEGNPPLVPTVRELLNKYPRAGVIGGKVLNADGSWGAFNYGPLPSLKYIAGTLRQVRLEGLSKTKPDKAKIAWSRPSRLAEGWPNPFLEPQPVSVGWVIEPLTIVTYGTFADLGGFDTSLRYCESADFGARLEKRGLERIFDPSITVRHLQIDNRGAKRYVEVVDAVAKLMVRDLLQR